VIVLRLGLRGLPLVAALALASCDESDDDGQGADENNDDSDDESSDDAAANDCSTETRADTYMLGLTKAGEQVQVKFVDAMPAPPARFDNTWTVELLDMADAPMDDMAIVVTPFMPDHQHGTTVVANVEPGDAPGQYVLEPVNLHMAGLWDVTLDITLPDTTTDSVTFSFCVDP
jgi:hypothetical protein